MPCNSPNKVFYTGINPETGKKKIFYTSRYTDYIWRRSPDDTWKTARLAESQTESHGIKQDIHYKDALSRLEAPPGGQLITDSDLVPCGQCLGCRLDYARSWSARMMLEAKQYKKNECWFVTFTYNDEHLPKMHHVREKVYNPITGAYKYAWREVQNEVLDLETGEYKPSPFSSVDKRVHELLMKNIRNEYGAGVRFFASWEYGSKSFRPHGHYIFFGLPMDDLEYYKCTDDGYILYKCPRLQRTCWKDEQGNELGYVIAGSVDFDSCNYVARYTIKKRKYVDVSAYKELGVEPEFCVMSRRPGIGSKYFEEKYKDIYETDSITLPAIDGAFTISPPPYYDSLLERMDPEKLEHIKSDRRLRRDNATNTIAHNRPNIDLEDIFEEKERRLEDKAILRQKGDL